jgi:hypothetical protein
MALAVVSSRARATFIYWAVLVAQFPIFLAAMVLWPSKPVWALAWALWGLGTLYRCVVQVRSADRFTNLKPVRLPLAIYGECLLMFAPVVIAALLARLMGVDGFAHL